MVKVSSVWLRKREGVDSGATRMVGTFEEANGVLRVWRATAPRGRAYDKCEFVVTYEDGEQYTGRYDLKREASVDIVQHMIDYLTFYAGVRCPAEMDPSRYESFIEHTTSPAKREAAVMFLGTYELRSAS